MPEYLHPGVYIEEIERGPRPIEGVATSTAAFLGETERGPTKPRLVTSYNDYKRWFGGVFNPNKYMPYAVSGFFENGGKRVFISRIVASPAQATTATITFGDLVVNAVGPGGFGNRIFVEIKQSTTKIPDPAQPNANPPPPVPVGIRVQVAYWSTVPNGFTPFNPITDTKTLPRPALVEDFDDLVFDEASADYFAKRVNDNSALITLGLVANPAQPPSVPINSGMLANGNDAGTAPSPDDFNGNDPDPSKRTGLAALLLDDYREVALVYEPGITDKDHLTNLISHCENQRYRFAVIDCAPNAGDPNSVDPRTNIQQTQYAAFYYPWIWISDPQTGARKKVPPGGHMLGIYARTDIERGVFKAPANEVVRGALDLEYAVDEVTQDGLNPRGVNAIRNFPGSGILLWGARTLSANSLWKYVSVRRLFIFLEHSIYDGTQWVVFEPNDERLWARVIDTITLFLRGQYRAGALMGATEKEAFFVTCDRTTMTQDDILNGRLVCEIGIAPVRPAEFVIFRIFQNTAEPQQ
jgi:phage tail sheath protein FI